MARKNKKNYKKGSDQKTKSTDKKGSDQKTKPTESKAEGQPTREEAIKEADTAAAEAGKKNDPAWYGIDPYMLNAAASLPYSHPFGEAFRLPPKMALSVKSNYGSKETFTGVSCANAVTQGISGICSLLLKPTIGYNWDWKDPVNVAATGFYTNVRYASSGRKNYDPCDLMMYALAIADIYSYVMFCKRLYAKAFIYSQSNKYVGKKLIEADGVNPTDLVAKLANFRYWLNTYINKVSSWLLPNDIALIMRKVFMYSGIYTESLVGNIKDQMYQFTPAYFYKFQLDSEGAGMLHAVAFRNEANPDLDYKTVEDLITFGESLLENINGDEDFGLMSGDILKAYEAGRIVTLASQEEAASIIPIYDQFILDQFKNATIAGYVDGDLDTGDQLQRMHYTVGSVDRDYGDVYQSGGLLQCKNAVAQGAGNVIGCAMQKLMSVPSVLPEPGENMEASRLMVSVSGTEANSSMRLITGTEIAVCAWISSGQVSPGNGGAWRTRTIHSSVLTSQDIDELFDVVEPQDIFDIMAYELNEFKHAPNRYFATYTGSGNNESVSAIKIISNLDNVAIIDDAMMTRLHECATLSLFYVPGVAKIVSTLGKTE